MNAIRGLDRIALLLAVIAIIPGFLFGMSVVYEAKIFRTVSKEYKAWDQEIEDDRIKLTSEYDALTSREIRQIINEKYQSAPADEWRQAIPPPLPHNGPTVLADLTPHYRPDSVDRDDIAAFIHVHSYKLLGSEPLKFQSPSLWKRIIGGLVSASIFFISVLFAIRGSTRGIMHLYPWIKRLSLWIIGGFKDEG